MKSYYRPGDENIPFDENEVWPPPPDEPITLEELLSDPMLAAQAEEWRAARPDLSDEDLRHWLQQI